MVYISGGIWYNYFVIGDDDNINKKRNEMKNGTHVEYYPGTDQMWIQENFKNGKRHGVREVWDENGKLKIRGNWKDGKLHGVREIWDENRKLWIRGNWKDGNLHGGCGGSAEGL